MSEIVFGTLNEGDRRSSPAAPRSPRQSTKCRRIALGHLAAVLGPFCLVLSLAQHANAQKSSPPANAPTQVTAAIDKLKAAESYRWTTRQAAQGGGQWGGGESTTEGEYSAPGLIWVKNQGANNRREFVRQGDHIATLVDGQWMTMAQAAERQPPARGRRAGGNNNELTNFLPPAQELQQIAASMPVWSADDNTLNAQLTTAAAQQLWGISAAGDAGGRGGRGGLRDAGGNVSVTLRDGQVASYTISLTAVAELRGNPQNVTRRATTELREVAVAQVSVPADAGEIVAALAAGREPNVFVAEPGFRKLFNGDDLTGWSGRPQHWTVEEGALTGRSTPEHPAEGNNFLIAMNGDQPLVVDDFELRFSYRIVANNSEGFANSGVQYRSRDLGNHVVGGYQADFEAGTTYSGILYDEAGGAGGRGIMAERGELVLWDATGQKKVLGQIAPSADIQAKIKANDWNEYKIVAQGNRLQHYINNQQTVGVVDETNDKRLMSGILAFQLHAGPPMTVQFKNVRWKSLSRVETVGSANVRLAKDFEMELLYNVPKETEGSWVAMCLDPQGRLIVCDQNGSLHRVTLPSVPGEEVTTEPIQVELGGAHGLLYAFDSLYVAVNEGDRPHGVYRVRDTNGDDEYDHVELLRQVQASGEHGLHSLVLSPDGKSIYVVIGNQSSLTEMASSRVPYNWSEDDLLPRLATGFMDDSYAPQGYISQMDPDGKNWELISIGLRNEFDVAFNREGELFTYDADMEWDIGEPWYRPTRVNHVTSGSEFGFRNGNSKWPDYYLDSLGAVVNIGPGSPTGIGFGYGAKFPPKYQEALFLADWSFGKLRAVHLSPDGASYSGEVEDFISGQPFPVTDFVINPHDGSMLLAVGGRGAQSALYRVTYVGTESTEPRPPAVQNQAQRDERRQLEAFHGRAVAGSVDKIWPFLSHSDRTIRYAARIALEWQDVSTWRDRALQETDPRRAIAALVALARVSGRDSYHQPKPAPTPPAELREKIVAALERFSATELPMADQLDLLRAYSLTFIRMGHPESATAARLSAKFTEQFPTHTPQIDMLLARLLIYLEAPTAAAEVVAALQTAPTQEEQIDYGVALRSLKSGWTPELRRKYFEWFAAAERFRGGNTLQSSLRTAKNEAIANLPEADKVALQEVLSAQVEQKSLRDVLAARPVVKQWTLDELIPVAEQGLKGGRNFAQGRTAFNAVACSACHRFANEGGSVGPELTGVVGRYSVRDLLESMVHPSKVISDQYQAVTFQTMDGRSVTGRVGNLNSDTVNVIEDMFDPGRMTSLRRADIELMRPSTVSMMPEGLLNTLTAAEIQDLVAYLLSRGDAQHPAFR